MQIPIYGGLTAIFNAIKFNLQILPINHFKYNIIYGDNCQKYQRRKKYGRIENHTYKKHPLVVYSYCKAWTLLKSFVFSRKRNFSTNDRSAYQLRLSQKTW